MWADSSRGEGPVKRPRLEAAISKDVPVHKALPVQFSRIERFSSHPEDRSTTTLPLALRGDPLFADLSTDSLGSVVFAETPKSLTVDPFDDTLPPAQQTARFNQIQQTKTLSPCLGICNSVVSATRFRNHSNGDMTIGGVTKAMANFRSLAFPGEFLIITPFACASLAGDKTGSVLEQDQRRVAQAIVAGCNLSQPSNRKLAGNFNMFAVCAASLGCFETAYTTGIICFYK